MINVILSSGFIHSIVLFIMLALLIPAGRAYSQEQPDSLSEIMKKAVRIYLDCSNCDEQYIRTEMKFVNFVRDRKEAEVHILVTTQTTGSGGREYTITFIGQNGMAGVNDTLLYTSKQNESDENIRIGLLQTLKLGLMKYVAKSPLADMIKISFTAPVTAQEKVKDSWNYWVFSLSVNGNFNGDAVTWSRGLYGSISANRVTPEQKINTSLYLNDYKRFYQIDDTTITESYSGSKSLYTLMVFSLSDQWSTGFTTSASTSTYSNNYYSLNIAPALEYNLFPYSEATRKQLRFLHSIGLTYKNYIDTTIYDKIKESLFYESLEIAVKVKQPWGSISGSLTGSHYFHDFNKNRVELWGNVSLNLFEGFSAEVSGGYSSIHDLLSLRRGTATPEDILLQRRQIETQYEYYVYFGISYSFGSIFNNVVNPRFGS
ncbi:MAG: hypothetical protein EPO24_12280 [Bacteroidetes bacterium]|nr:MAG: hypothetical protein EPO24_12280 [Bacteroidota bacterium]